MKKIAFTISILLILCFLFFFVFKKPKETKTIVKFSSWGSQSETELLKPLLKEFEKQNPDIKIEFIHIPQNYFQKLHLLFASNLAPDVVFINNYYAPKYIQSGLLEDLTPFFNKNEYFKKSYEGFCFNNKIYAIPRDVSNLVVYYNKDLFKKYDVPYPSNNWSIEDYIKTAKQLTQDINSDKKTDIWGTSFEKDVIFWLPYLFSNNASILSDDGSTILINKKESINSLDLYSDLVNKYKVAPSKADNASLTMAQLFLQQKLAMQISGRWLVPKYRAEANFDWDIAPFPQGTNGSVVNIDASGYAISKSSKHKKEALKFVKFISSNEALEKLVESGLIVPARKDTAFSEKFLEKNKKPKNAAVFLRAIENGKTTPVNKNYQKLTDRLNIILEPVFLGQKKAREVLTPEQVIILNRF